MLFKVVRAQLIVVSSNAAATVTLFSRVTDATQCCFLFALRFFLRRKKEEVALSHFSGVYYSGLFLALARHSSQLMIIIWLYKGVCITNSRIYI
jgi:hypothetical protein